MDDIHGFDANFVDDDLPDHLLCSICLMILKNPVQLADCGHRFCSDCFTSIKDHSASRNEDVLCPNDRIVIQNSKVFEDKAIERVILELKVHCDNKCDGCPWIGELRQLKSHLDVNCMINGQETLFSTTLQIQKLSQNLEQHAYANHIKSRMLEDLYQELATRCLLLKEQLTETSVSQGDIRAFVTQEQEKMRVSETKLSVKMKKIENELELLKLDLLINKANIQNLSDKLTQKIFSCFFVFFIMAAIVIMLFK